jgi:hypothetical protein
MSLGEFNMLIHAVGGTPAVIPPGYWSVDDL